MSPLTAWPAVKALLLHCRPFNIRRVVIAVVVDTVDAVRHGRPWSDISKKRAEVIYPPFANLDPATAVEQPAPRAWISASLFDALPNHKLAGSSATAPRPSVLSGSLGAQPCRYLPVVAAAGLYSTGLQAVEHVRAGVATITTTLDGIHVSVAIPLGCGDVLRDHDNPSKALPYAKVWTPLPVWDLSLFHLPILQEIR